MNERIENTSVGEATSRTHNLREYVAQRGGVLYIYRDSILVG